MAKTPGFVRALLCFTGILLIISFGLFVYSISLHSLLFLCIIRAGVNSFLIGNSYADIQSAMTSSISKAIPAIYIFFLIPSR